MYEEHFLKPELIELPSDAVDDKLAKEALAAKKSKQSDLININYFQNR